MLIQNKKIRNEPICQKYLAMLRQNPDNLEALAVLGDHLLERGEPYGSFISASLEYKHSNPGPGKRNSLVEIMRDASHQMFHIEEFDDFYRLHNIVDNGGLYIFDWQKKLLDNGNTHTSDEWVDLEKERNPKIHEPRIPNSRQYFNTFDILEANKNHTNEEQRKLVDACSQMHLEDFRDLWMLTSTSLIYRPGKELDSVIHNYGYGNQEEPIDLNFQGKNEWIRLKSGLQDQVEAIFGTRNLRQVKKTIEDFSGQSPRLWRLNNVQQKTQRALGLGLDAVRFSVDADVFYDYGGGSARGVAIRRAARA